MFPAVAAAIPPILSRCPTSAVVVVLPLVPVMQAVLIPGIARSPSSVSAIWGTAAAAAAFRAGAFGLTPGETTASCALPTRSRSCPLVWPVAPS